MCDDPSCKSHTPPEFVPAADASVAALSRRMTILEDVAYIQFREMLLAAL
jgi:hypothetical protein